MQRLFFLARNVKINCVLKTESTYPTYSSQFSKASAIQETAYQK